MKLSYYELLEINHNSSKPEIVASFKKLAKHTHPDVSSAVNANEAMAKLLEAYTILSSDLKRLSYDSGLSQSDKIRIEQNYKLYSNAVGMFNKLSEHIGKEVTVAYAWYGCQDSITEGLSFVNDFENLQVGCMGIPFIGNDSAILRVTSQDGEVLYSNPNISPNYDGRKLEDRTSVQALSWGRAIAQRNFDRESAYWKKQKEAKAKMMLKQKRINQN